MRRHITPSVIPSVEVEPPQTGPRYVRDKAMAPQINVTPSYLQKDRRSPNPTIPFIKIGDRILYHPPSVFAALEAQQKTRR